jgi:hypothetical protein
VRLGVEAEFCHDISGGERQGAAMWKWLNTRTVPRWSYGLLLMSFVGLSVAFWAANHTFWVLHTSFNDLLDTCRIAQHPELYRGLLAGRGTRENPLTMDDLAPVLKAIRQLEDARSPEL